MFSTICGTFKKRATGSFLDFGEANMGPGAHLRITGIHFGRIRDVCVYILYHEVSNDVLNDVLCAVSLSGTMRSAMSVLLEKNFLLPMPAVAIFSMAKGSCAVKTILGVKCLQALRI